jgi:hypothetical protein
MEDRSGGMLSARLPAPGFGEFQVPEMPAYTQRYSKRGNAFAGQTTPVFQQARFGNREGIGGMGPYLSGAEDDTFFEGVQTKRGNMGVFESTRWQPGEDFRGNFGVASLAELKNFPGLMTRGGGLRAGGPRRSDYIDRKNYWFESVRPGTDLFAQNGENFAGIREEQRRTPVVMTEVDALPLRAMIENNPFHISSHSARQAKRMYDAEFS